MRFFMEYTEFKDLFNRSLTKNGLESLSEAQTRQFYDFTLYLLDVNCTTNLTAIRNIPDVIDKHLTDSLLIAKHIPSQARILDLGCGPGFPSIPLTIARADLQITALDSTAKKIGFVEAAAKKIGLTNLIAISGRAEDRALMKKLGSFDAVVSRAVARLNVLCELCLPYIKIDGKLLAMKGAKADEELLEAQKGICILGGSAPQAIPYTLHLSDGHFEARAMITCTKETPTPSIYPRVYASILKKPL